VGIWQALKQKRAVAADRKRTVFIATLFLAKPVQKPKVDVRKIIPLSEYSVEIF